MRRISNLRHGTGIKLELRKEYLNSKWSISTQTENKIQDESST